MSGRRNFLDADNSIMENNLRFVKSELEDNFNQYFTGSRDSRRGNDVNTSLAPPRDYKVVQPSPDDKYERTVSFSKYNKNYWQNLRDGREEQSSSFRNDGIKLQDSNERNSVCFEETSFAGWKVNTFGDNCNSYYKQNNNFGNKSFYSNEYYSGNPDQFSGWSAGQSQNYFTNHNRNVFRIDNISGNTDRFDDSRKGVCPENKYESTTPTTNRRRMKRTFQCHEKPESSKSARIVRNASSFISSTNNQAATFASTSGNNMKDKRIAKKKKKDNQAHRRFKANVRSREEKAMRADGRIKKPKKGCSKFEPENYWKAWWPQYAHIEKSIRLMLNEEDNKFLQTYISFQWKPSDPEFKESKKILLQLGVNKIKRTLDITECNYMARDIFKFFKYKKQLEDAGFHQYLTEDELKNVTNVLNSANGKVKLALFHQSLIYRWHASTLILERKKMGENIPSKHAENLMNDKLFHYLVLDSLKELKQLCSSEWTDFNEFYKSL